MPNILKSLLSINLEASADKLKVVDQVEKIATDNGYAVVDRNDSKPWGAFLRLDSKDASKFTNSFFPGLSIDEARLGNDDTELSPKFLIVSPEQRLSWQKHNRRAERWAFLTKANYYKSLTDEQGNMIKAQAGEVVQFAKEERHRLVGTSRQYALVAEIWQHTDPNHLSDEDDIVRLSDDYQR